MFAYHKSGPGSIIGAKPIRGALAHCCDSDGSFFLRAEVITIGASALSKKFGGGPALLYVDQQTTACLPLGNGEDLGQVELLSLVEKVQAGSLERKKLT